MEFLLPKNLGVPFCLGCRRSSVSSPSPFWTPQQAHDVPKSSKKIAVKDGGDLAVPTFTPSHASGDNKHREHRISAITAGGVGAAVLVIIAVMIVYFCLMHVKRSTRRTSETGSSEPSPHVDWARGKGSSHANILSPCEVFSLRQLTIKELEHATSNFSQNNIIGEGGFGLVYKGLLQDGSIVAVKRRFHEPTQYFLQEVKNIGHIHHRHIVKLIGYCQEYHQQLLVYNFLPNGNVGSHLYDSEGLPIGKLDVRQRVSIALGAAKGLEFLHGQVPPLLHMHFKTSNVLVDENFTAKVADFGLSKLLSGGNRAGPSSSIDCFIDPELSLANGVSVRSDIYGYGVFLLELISGHEANNRKQSEKGLDLVEQAKTTCDPCGYIDKMLQKIPSDDVRSMMELALQCVDAGARRPKMSMVVRALELIREREMGHQQTQGHGEEIGVVTLGSDLFK